jgi:hypothetical protein
MSTDATTDPTAEEHDPRDRPASSASPPATARPFVALVPALAAGIVVYVAYLFTHPYPALGGGLFLAMAEAVAANGYALPARIAGYTPGGIPFAYPPLAFYPLAFLLNAGLDPLAITRFLPGLLTICALIPTYALGRQLLGSDAEAGFAALVVATSPAVLTWHLSAGGAVRTLAFFLTVCGLYAGYRLFCDGDRRWVFPAAILFGLVVLTHPLYPVLFGFSLLYFYLARDRSLRGLALGAGVAGGGVALAAPWWLTVGVRHGFGVFARTAGSRLAIGQGLIWFPTNFAYLPETRFLALWHVLLVLGALYFLAHRRYFLVGWLAAVALAYPEPRFLLFVGAFPISAFVFEGFLPALTGDVDGGGDAGTGTDGDGESGAGGRLVGSLNRLWSWGRGSNPERRDRAVALAVLSVLALYGLTTGALYAANYEPIPERPLDRLLADPLPAYVDGADVRAMNWVGRNTPTDARFLVAGDAAEWFPLLANRTSVASPWGAEWLPPPRRTEQIEQYRAAAECRTESCLTDVLDRTAPSPEYLYVPREGSRSWTARDELSSDQGRELVEQFERSNRYGIVYRNRGVLIVRSLDPPQPNDRSSVRSAPAHSLGSSSPARPTRPRLPDSLFSVHPGDDEYVWQCQHRQQDKIQRDQSRNVGDRC